MPVINILSSDVTKLTFTWKSFRTVYAIFCCACLISYNILTVAWMLKEGVEFGRFVTVIFYTSNFMALICFLRLSMFWPKIMRRWQATEDLMSPFLKERSQRYLKMKLRLLATVILSLSLGELISIFTLKNTIYLAHIRTFGRRMHCRITFYFILLPFFTS